jgi:hypothetical protein
MKPEEPALERTAAPATPEDRREAGRLAYSVFMRLGSDFGEVRGFRKTMELVEGHAQEAVREDVKRHIPLLMQVPPLAELFLPGGRFAGEKEQGGLIDGMTKGQLENTRRARDKSSIVLAHAAFDALLSDFLRILGLCDANAFRPWLDDKKVSLSSALDEDGDTLLRRLVSEEIDRLERESVIVRIRRLLGILKVEPGSLRASQIGYSYSEDELAGIDKGRNDLLHGRPQLVDLSDVDKSIAFLEATVGNLWAKIVLKYGLTPEMVTAWNEAVDGARKS